MSDTTVRTDTYQELLKAARARPWCTKTARDFFAAYEKRRERDEKDRETYLHLKCLCDGFEPNRLNELGKRYLSAGQPFRAYMCLLESLRTDAVQDDIFELCQSLSSHAEPEFPERLCADEVTVSVIMTTYDRSPEIISPAVESVLQQSFRDFELVIISDGGPNETRRFLESFRSDRIRYFRLSRNRGKPEANNKGITEARGKYIAYLDDDDVYHPNHLEVLVRAIESSGYRYVYENTHGIKGRMIDGRFRQEGTSFVWARDFDRDLLLREIYIQPDSVIHEKKLFAEVGLYRRELMISQDWDMWLRMALRCAFLHLDTSTAEYRLRSDNRTIQDKTKGHFWGALVGRYYEFGQGKIARLKRLSAKGKTKDAQEFYLGIKGDYESYFKGVVYLRELIDIARHFGDTRFLMRLSRDYFKAGPRRWKKEALSHRPFEMILGALPAVPVKVYEKLKRGCLMRRHTRI